jgi:hypothetical protein
MWTWSRSASHRVILGRNPAARAPMRCAGGATAGYSSGRSGRPDRIASCERACLSSRRSGGAEGEITWLTMQAVSSTFTRARETMGAASATVRVCRRFVGWMPMLAGMVSVPLPQLERTLLSREQKPAGSSTGARCLLWSGQGIRWRLCRGCA